MGSPHSAATPKPGTRAATTQTLPVIIVPTHGMTRYLRVRLGVADGVMEWQVPRTILGIVPFGVRRVAVPVASIRVVRIHRTLRPVSAVAGLACIALPIAVQWWWLVVPFCAGGLALIAISVGPRLEATTARGRTYRADVCFGHEFDADLYAEAVLDMARSLREPTTPGPMP